MKRRLRSAHHAAAYIDTQAALVLSGPDVYKDWNTNIIDFESCDFYLYVGDDTTNSEFLTCMSKLSKYKLFEL